MTLRQGTAGCRPCLAYHTVGQSETQLEHLASHTSRSSTKLWCHTQVNSNMVSDSQPRRTRAVIQSEIANGTSRPAWTSRARTPWSKRGRARLSVRMRDRQSLARIDPRYPGGSPAMAVDRVSLAIVVRTRRAAQSSDMVWAPCAGRKMCAAGLGCCVREHTEAPTTRPSTRQAEKTRIRTVTARPSKICASVSVSLSAASRAGASTWNGRSGEVRLASRAARTLLRFYTTSNSLSASARAQRTPTVRVWHIGSGRWRRQGATKT